MTFNHDASQLAAIFPFSTQTVYFWNSDTGDSIGGPIFVHQALGIEGMGFSQDGRLLATAGGVGNDLLVWDMSTGTPLRQFHMEWPSRVMFRSDGTLLVSSICSNADVWNVETGENVLRSPCIGGFGSAGSAAFNPQGTLLVTPRDPMMNDGDLIPVWDVEKQTEVVELAGHTGGGNYGVAFSHDGKILASTGSDYSVKLWDTGARKPIRTLSIGNATLVSTAFSPDGRMIAASGCVGDEFDCQIPEIWIWNLAGGDPITIRPELHKDIVQDVLFSPRGDLLISISTTVWGVRNSIIQFWSPLDGTELFRMPELRGIVSLTFHPQGHLLVVADANGTIWGVRSN